MKVKASQRSSRKLYSRWKFMLVILVFISIAILFDAILESNVVLLNVIEEIVPSEDYITAPQFSVVSHSLNVSSHEHTNNESYQFFSYPHNDEKYEAIQEWRRTRFQHFESWYKPGTLETKNSKLIKDADANGTILDFVIVGFAKCGTSAMHAMLGHLAPMPNPRDICVPVPNLVFYSYMSWPKIHGEEKLLRGNKCPRYITSLTKFDKSTSSALMIVGIRHPLRFYESFWNMFARSGQINNNESPYNRQEVCPHKKGNGCTDECPNKQFFCLPRARFHLPLARLGKTELTETERQLLAPNDPDGGLALPNHKIRNPLFLYELNQFNDEELWTTLAQTLQVPNIPYKQYTEEQKEKVHDRYKDHKDVINICNATFDNLRADFMPHAYNMSVWLTEYLLPQDRNLNRTDVIIPDYDRFYDIVWDYRNDPCGKLTRLDNGTYILKENFEINEE